MTSSVDYDFHTGLCRLAAAGDVDSRSATELRQNVLNALAEHPRALILDLDRVTHPAELSSQVFPTLMRRQGTAPVLVLASRQSECGQAIRGRRYTDLTVYETEADALAALANETVPEQCHMQAHLEAEDSAPQSGRRLVTRACAQWGLGEISAVSEVIVSELVSNAVRHAGSDIEVTVALGAHYLHLHVRDRSRQLPTLPMPPRGVPTDRHGTRLVDRLSSEWGTNVMPFGKTVWATVALPVGYSGN